jgi:hypothetical protein
MFQVVYEPQLFNGQMVTDGGKFSKFCIKYAENSSFFICQSCKFKSCYQCRTTSHPGLTCAQNLNALESCQFPADEPSGSWLKSFTKVCYCGRWIQKEDGCDQVKCPPRPVGCGEEWCWTCGAKYEEIRKSGNTVHKADCPYYG